MYRSQQQAVPWAVLLRAVTFVLAVLICRSAAAGPGQESMRRQHQINEIAAKVLDVHLDLKDASAALSQSESPTARTKRLLGYADVIEGAVQALKSVASLPPPAHQDADNVKRWDRLRAAGRQLPLEISGYRKRVLSQTALPVVSAALTELRRAIWNVYEDLRDALP